jgi:hypothetical protein
MFPVLFVRTPLLKGERMKVLVIATILIFSSTPAQAYFQMDLLKGKKTNKEATQWTLADWLTQKNKIATLDHWLALNRSANWFELNLSAEKGTLKLKNTDAAAVQTTVDQDSQTYSADMYLSIFNINGEYEKTSTDTENAENYGGALGVRLFGTSSQTTSLTARYGLYKHHNLTTLEEWQNQYVEGHLQLYIVQMFGLQGQYRHYFPHDSNQGTELSGYKASAGAFLEFFIFRVYANAYQEPMKYTASDGTVTKQDRSGIEGGVKLFF